MVGRFATILSLGCYAILFAATVLGVWLGLLVVPFPWPVTLALVLPPFAFSVLHACRSIGPRRGLWLMLLTLVASLLAESVGVLTATVFGPYEYTSVLGPCFLGLVPYSVPMVWFILVYPAYVMAEWFVPAGWAGPQRWLAVASLSATMVTAVDIALDPVMVEAGAWVWRVNGSFFGIPIRNYVGWWLTVLVILSMYSRLCVLPRVWRPLRSACLARLAIFSYSVFSFATIGVALHMRLPGPALAGMLTTGIWVAAGLRSTRSAPTHTPQALLVIQERATDHSAKNPLRFLSIRDNMAVFPGITL